MVLIRIEMGISADQMSHTVLVCIQRVCMIEMGISPRSVVTSVGIQGVQTVAQLLPPWIRIEMGISPNQMSHTVSVGKRGIQGIQGMQDQGRV